MTKKSNNRFSSCITNLFFSPILIPFWILLFSFEIMNVILKAISLVLKVIFRIPLSTPASHRLQPLYELSGKDFENYLCDLFEKMGYTVKHKSIGVDQGADLVINKNDQDIVVQAKRHSYKVTNKAVQEAVAAIGYYRCHSAMVVTNSVFTEAAKELAVANGIDLIDGYELNRLIQKYLDK